MSRLAREERGRPRVLLARHLLRAGLVPGTGSTMGRYLYVPSSSCDTSVTMRDPFSGKLQTDRKLSCQPYI